MPRKALVLEPKAVCRQCVVPGSSIRRINLSHLAPSLLGFKGNRLLRLSRSIAEFWGALRNASLRLQKLFPR